MRKGCERIRSSEIEIVDKVKNLGAIVDAIALELFCGKIRWNSYFLICYLRNNRKKMRKYIEKGYMLCYSRRGRAYYEVYS